MQLFGGPQDGLLVPPIPPHILFYVQNGHSYSRRIDGRFYYERCLWDDVPPPVGAAN